MASPCPVKPPVMRAARPSSGLRPTALPRLREPPTLGNLQPVNIIIRRYDRPVSKLRRMDIDEVVEHQDDRAAILGEHILCIGIDLCALGIVGFATCGREHFVKFSI